jgi:NADH-ubiquinone oxidoreductase chain 5
MSGIRASYENDFKKIIALSTLRQLGLIMTILRLGLNLLGFYHLLTHAVFKSLLFMLFAFIICFLIIPKYFIKNLYPSSFFILT